MHFTFSLPFIKLCFFCRLVETTYKKKEFMTTIKAVMAKIKARVEEEFPADKDKFTKQSAKFVKEQVIDNFKDWGFYCGR